MILLEAPVLHHSYARQTPLDPSLVRSTLNDMCRPVINLSIHSKSLQLWSKCMWLKQSKTSSIQFSLRKTDVTQKAKQVSISLLMVHIEIGIHRCELLPLALFLEFKPPRLRCKEAPEEKKHSTLRRDSDWSVGVSDGLLISKLWTQL